ncbi:sarcosine oxidase subunit gamma [Azorhizobium doebereinerae]|uniref:sarcosine oxidase subunit gamma n=1 Tax=Azorhizobium doebereinerae TaxID=281091 RepID=UPI000688043C|nr:sarcosine oxidase subunit gamma family protein [Azorhizobium doebereinerae]
MLETSQAPRRCSVLAPAPKAGQTQVQPLGPATRFVLRVYDAEIAPLAEAGGFDLSGAINTCRSTQAGIAARLGPDEWLLIAPEGSGARIVAACGAALAGRVFSLVEVSHRNVALEVSGPHGREVLNAGIPLDLADAAFPAGSATRTLLGKADVVLVRAGAAAVYRVECWRSFGPYVQGFLNDAAREFA